MKPRTDLDAELERLQRRLQDLARDRPPPAVLEAFAAESRPLLAGLPPEDEAYVNSRLNCMLAAAGLVAGEPEGEPCPTGNEADAPETPRGEGNDGQVTSGSPRTRDAGLPPDRRSR